MWWIRAYTVCKGLMQKVSDTYVRRYVLSLIYTFGWLRNVHMYNIFKIKLEFIFISLALDYCSLKVQ